MTILPGLALDLSGNDFLLPYMQQVFPVPDNDPDYQMPQPVGAVKVITKCTGAATDPDFEAYCSEHGLPVAVLYCPYIVGTNMNGLPRRIAAGICRGTYVQIKGNVARISLVHATDVALAAKMALGCQGSYVLTDGIDHTMLDFADALAYRIDNKRLFAISPRWAKLWYGKKYFALLTDNHLMPDTFRSAFPDFKPKGVLEYMRTHDYANDSF